MLKRKRLSKVDWKLLSMALYRAAEWERELADSYTDDPLFTEEKKESRELEQQFRDLRGRFSREARSL
jgi:hypothetical protein